MRFTPRGYCKILAHYVVKSYESASSSSNFILLDQAHSEFLIKSSKTPFSASLVTHLCSAGP